MRRRRAGGLPRDEAAGELAGLERVCAGEQLAAVRSWQWMLRAAGGDPEIRELVLEFARELS